MQSSITPAIYLWYQYNPVTKTKKKIVAWLRMHAMSGIISDIISGELDQVKSQANSLIPSILYVDAEDAQGYLFLVQLKLDSVVAVKKIINKAKAISMFVAHSRKF
jgi:hypothetical protein